METEKDRGRQRHRWRRREEETGSVGRGKTPPERPGSSAEDTQRHREMLTHSSKERWRRVR